ncbi:HalOD1 output domain-containing protein [Halobacterium litoreum]|uniref:HalOD1 output domain-containing protein n=1 Tax=Halobacterium litoreum TaxID=2039234 RepID=A0ABD5NHD7_9EURY|nr:HalOD1 output domain-containing protein [Halobacterium litoreum]UHH12871.1 hypothetical protein LT972_11970 [Halobacterium litoreum]
MTRDTLPARVVEAVAAADGVEPADVETLHAYVDPDALRKLDEQDGGEWRLTFQFADHQVTVTHEARVLVDGRAYAADASVR